MQIRLSAVFLWFATIWWIQADLRCRNGISVQFIWFFSIKFNAAHNLKGKILKIIQMQNKTQKKNIVEKKLSIIERQWKDLPFEYKRLRFSS